MGDDGRALVELDQVTKSFGDNVVLNDVDLKIERGSATVIAGPSGSGKSTMLRCINGLEPIDSGRFDTKIAASSPTLTPSPAAMPMPNTACSGIPSRNAPSASPDPAPGPRLRSRRRSRRRPAVARRC